MSATAGSAWDERAASYRSSETHRQGPDLDKLLELCEGRIGLTALDVAAGGGHVAHRLRRAGCTVTTLDASPAMRPDVVAPAESMPFPDASFDIVTSRVAAHHFEDIEAAMGEMARVARDRVVVQDMLFQSEDVEQAERLRDPTHVRTYSRDEWSSYLAQAGLALDRVELIEKRLPLDDWLARTGCEGADADRARSLLADRMDGDAWTTTMIVARGRRR
ncbi:MAG: class I SAM-dependent methyltransferase [Gaiellales bacterium]